MQGPMESEYPGGWAKFAEKGPSESSRHSGWARTLFERALESGTQTSTLAHPCRVCACEWFGRLPAVAPPEPGLSSLSCPPAVRDSPPGGHPNTAGSLAGILGGSCSVPGPEEEMEGRVERLVQLSSDSACSALPGSQERWLSLEAPIPAPAAAPSSPCLALGSGEEARWGGRPGHCAAGAGNCGRARPAPLPRLLGRTPLPRPRDTRDLGKPAASCGAVGLWSPSGRPTGPRCAQLAAFGKRGGGGGLFICNIEESAASGQPVTHAPTRTVLSAGSLT